MTLTRLTFVMEQTLGHIPFAQNLRRTVDADTGVAVTWLQITFPPQSRFERLPGVRGNWSLRGSAKARAAVAAARTPAGPPDVYLYHTQVISLLSAGWVDRAVPAVVSLDATPINYDAVGLAYGHQVGNPQIEKAKFWLNRRAFHHAAHLLTWSEWARQSLITDYGVAGGKVTVVPPGTHLPFWQEAAATRQERQPGDPIRILFVGGDFARKGGALLYETFRHHFAERAELHLVTQGDVAEGNGVHVYRAIRPNTPEMQALFRQADIFVLPTAGDCLPVAITEAMAARLPVVTTDVGAIREAVVPGENGFVITPGDGAALAQSLTRLIEDAELRRTMGARGQERARRDFDAARNGPRVLDICKALAAQPHNAPVHV